MELFQVLGEVFLVQSEIKMAGNGDEVSHVDLCNHVEELAMNLHEHGEALKSLKDVPAMLELLARSVGVNFPNAQEPDAVSVIADESDTSSTFKNWMDNIQTKQQTVLFQKSCAKHWRILNVVWRFLRPHQKAKTSWQLYSTPSSKDEWRDLE
ncbi:unnamed protein product [Orchesella dallaii]|uniref:Uncharacterized protein n=1 Tax=Orchesella dallaii TaxID=48710 RepID=A0ABP1S5I8_9HEXA